MNQVMVGKHKLTTLLLVIATVSFFFALISKNMTAAETTKAPAQPQAKAMMKETLVSKTEPEIKMIEKTMSGEVSAKGPNGVAVVYEKDLKKRASFEMYFPFESNTTLTGYESKADIQEGDSVLATYEEAEDGSKRILLDLKLMKKKPAEVEEIDEEEDQ